MSAVGPDLVRMISEAVDRHADSIRIPSVTGAEDAAADFYARQLRDLGLEVTTETVDRVCVGDAFEFWDQETDLEHRPNVYARWAVDGCPPLVFNGHLDVILPGPEDRWADPPFGATVSEGRVIGRGAADMKGGLAAAIGALRILRSLGLSPAADLAVQCVMGRRQAGSGLSPQSARGSRLAPRLRLSRRVSHSPRPSPDT